MTVVAFKGWMVQRYEHAHCLDSLLLIDHSYTIVEPLMGQSTGWGSLSSSTRWVNFNGWLHLLIHYKLVMKMYTFIRSFHSSVKSTPPMQNALYSPLIRLNPHNIDWRGPPSIWCAERKAGVDTMRVEMTFLWMSDLVSEWGDGVIWVSITDCEIVGLEINIVVSGIQPIEALSVWWRC